MSIESYGGNPDIVATRAEIERSAFQIKLCAQELTSWPSLDLLLQDPALQLQFRLAAVSICQKLDRLHNHCLMAAENYFTTEAQIHRRFEITFVPALAKAASSLLELAGWKLDSNVSVQVVKQSKTLPPKTITNMLDRLWQLSAKDSPTIGVDRFVQTDGTGVAVVYIPGTQTIGDGKNPLDMASNILAMAEPAKATSEKAVLLAMKQAGISATDEVIFVGHSQGGMVAGNLMAHPVGFTAAAMVSFGAPLAQLRKINAPVMAVEHSNDPVPNLSGKANPLKRNWVTVQRISEKPESKALLFSHSLKSYRNTSLAIDASSDVGIKNVRTKVFQKIDNAKPVSSLDFVISRESR